ncbi:MAG: acetate--CoA ligase [Bacillota bacterium]|nr:MAG: acetate--CoA ligase [Bacillota bacterium]
MVADSSAHSPDIIWRPTAAQVQGSNVHRLMVRHGLPSYEALLDRSTAEPGWFWEAVVDDLGISWYRRFDTVLDLAAGLQWPKWFRGGLMNVANDCVDKHAGGTARRKTAVIWEGEEGTAASLTYQDLYEAANRLANGLQKLGVGVGDRVGVFLPMIPETVVAIMSLAKLGAVVLPIFSGYGPEAAATRLRDAEAKILITADGFWRRGRQVAMKEVADAAAALTPSVERVLVARRLGREVPWTRGRDFWWHDVVADQPREFTTLPMDPEDPLMIIYTSGTTGRPKGAVHVHAGFPLKSAQDMAHHFDLRASDIMFWFTDIGWMMGPWLIYGTLTLGSTVFLYDGAPDYPGPDRLWSMVERHRITQLGISPTLVRSLMPLGEEWVERHDLSSLRMLGSTGEPWNPDPYLWFFRTVGKGRCPIINYSGGTEISGGIVAGSPCLPLKVASFSGPCLGIAADVVGEDGRPVRGQVGELVIRGPWPGITRGFWKDPDRYVDTYWSRWPGTWYHGDWASIDEDGFWFIHGRSDDTIKIGGKRVGPAEFESALVSHPAVAEAAVVGVPHEVKGEAAVCFVVLEPGLEPSEELRQALKEQVVTSLGKALRPDDLKFVAKIPKTRNAKVMRRVIRACYLGIEPGDTSALEDPGALDEIARAR